MQAVPPELMSEIMALALRDISQREEGSKARGQVASVNKRWRDILYDTGEISPSRMQRTKRIESGELWDVVFVHFGMDLAHIKHICDLASKPSAPLADLHVSSEKEHEPDADDLEGCDSIQELTLWVVAVAGFLAPVVANSKAIRVDSAAPHGIFMLLGSMGTQHALQLRRLKCYATIPHTDNFNYLQSVRSRRLQHLSVSRIHPFGLVPVGQSPNLLFGVTVLRMLYISCLDWDQMRAILISCNALEELDVVDIDCSGDPGLAVIQLPHLHTLNIDIAEAGGLELAAILRTPAIVTLVVRGVSDSNWARFILDFGEALRSVRNCCICTWVYTDSIRALIGELHTVEAIDIRAGRSRFLADLTRTDQNGRPVLKQLKRWIVSAEITFDQATVLFGWPEARVESIYAEKKDDEENRFVRWEQVDEGYNLRVIRVENEPYFV
ncbi:hypothetical protein R3P38DRAFT_3190729 [Favolaschia claudopus]|uniref:F-box domain-containing protein n=1 Tax=Favolaschia claudopus TaxID=2862362 RepID=A0AAW0BQ58_9AGAR